MACFYVAFEDRFRGSRDAIKERQKVYLSRVTDIARRLGGSVLDIGCGRGEWLELLAESKIPAQGVDANAVAAADCRRLGLDVATGDAIVRLRSLPEESLAVVSAFHLIEHLPLAALLVLLEEALRVLKPGGLLILETPNPGNLQVGACSFWTDPTHLRPLPSETTAFIVERQGFREVEVLALHPLGEASRIYDDPLQDRLNQLLHGPQDYAVLASKAGGRATMSM
jgi:O-antigen chain-terminating methyltransferase